MLMAELLYEAKPTLDRDQLQQRLRTRLPQSKVDAPGAGLLVLHENNLVHFKDGSIPAQTAIMVADRPQLAQADTALQQTRDWPEARAAVARSGHQILLTELMARTLDPHTRLHLFQSVLVELVQLTPPLAVHMQHADRIVDPARLVQAARSTNPADLVFTSLNVRLFRIENGDPGDTLMDTRGLAALGLPDIQMHFRNLNPGQVAGFLYNCAYYLFENGDCIADGNTIQGLTPEQKWRCQHDDSLVPPLRHVLDVNPGLPYAAGKRS
jgi:hypothetical protein